MLDEVVVLIPLYSRKLSLLEEETVTNNIKKLKAHSLFIICPESLNFSKYSLLIREQKKIYFPAHCFQSLEGYNKLLRSDAFYSKFTAFQYILIVQADAYIFTDAISRFISDKYDYWGAPWIDFELMEYKFLRPVLPLFHKSIYLRRLRRIIGPRYLVGNGGLSLRRVKTHLFVTENFRDRILEFESHYQDWILGGAKSMMEDVFWCLYVPQFYPKYKIAPWRKALEFSFEMSPSRAYELNGNRLPFGCHAFSKVDPVFFEDFIPFLKQGNKEVSNA